MKTNIILYNTETNKKHFKLSSGIRPWGILLAISKGCFRLSIPSLDKSEIIFPYEIAYVPPNTEFSREIIEPIDFHQFAFQIYETKDQIGALEPGKQRLPKEQLKSILNSADMLSFFPSSSEYLSKHILHRILIDNYLFCNTELAPHVSQEMLLAIEYIHKNIRESLSVAMLAEKLHLSHNGLIWKFKKELNMTPVNYINACRIKRAKQLLFDSNQTISEIAENCGYANAYYFSNAFKKAEGISPSAFRKKCTR